jgi:hypothetical protein
MPIKYFEQCGVTRREQIISVFSEASAYLNNDALLHPQLLYQLSRWLEIMLLMVGGSSPS